VIIKNYLKIKAMKKVAITMISLAVFLATKTYAQTAAKEKANAIAAEFNKEKNKVKQKNGVTTERHEVIEAKPDFRDDISSYAGKYELNGNGDHIVLKYLNTNWEADYIQMQDNKELKKGILTNIKIESALLTATLQYLDGKTAPVEGVFINRFKNGEKIPGLGIREVLDLSSGLLVGKAFYKRVEN
jgi:hypothetical protein